MSTIERAVSLGLRLWPKPFGDQGDADAAAHLAEQLFCKQVVYR